MSSYDDDIISRMVEETFIGVEDISPIIEHNELSFDLYYSVDKKCFLYRDMEIPANFGPFKLITEQGHSSLFIDCAHEFYRDLSVIFNRYPSCFKIGWKGQALNIFCAEDASQQAA